MKNPLKLIKGLLIVLPALLLVTKLSAQTFCKSPTSPSPPPASPQPANCKDFLKDFIPNAIDPTLEVNLTIWVFRPSNSNWGAWDVTNANTVDWVTTKMNSHMSSLSPVWISVGAPHLSNSKINYKIKQIQFITDASCYNDLQTVGSNYFDPHAINVYYGLYNSTYPASAWSVGFTRRIFMSTSATSGQDVAHTWDVLIHELGHALGLFNHTDIAEGDNYIYPTFGCCNAIKVDDVYQEPAGIFGNSGDCEINPVPPAPVPANANNNIMGYNWRCRSYLSPLQIALMHYHLRTNLVDVLTPQSYIDATTADASVHSVANAD